MRWFSGLPMSSLSLQIHCLPRTDILQARILSSTLKSQCMAGKGLVTWAYFAGTETNVARARHEQTNFMNVPLSSHGQIQPSAGSFRLMRMAHGHIHIIHNPTNTKQAVQSSESHLPTRIAVPPQENISNYAETP